VRADGVVSAHESAVACAEQKLRLHKPAKERVTHGTVQSPQALRLRDSQPQTRHLEVLPLNASKHLEWLFQCRHFLSRWVVSMMSMTVAE
jgi:hypothetical protein